MSDSLLSRLRQETAQPHRELEDAVGIASVVTEMESYRSLLKQFLGFYGPMEELLASAHDWSQEGLDFDSRRKAGRLRHDLGALGASHEEMTALPACRSLPEVHGVAAAFGCFYVLEGSTLGGRHISAMMSASHVPEGARTFFHGYGADTGAMWKAFCTALESWGTRSDEAARAATIEGASATFRSLHKWIAESRATTP